MAIPDRPLPRLRHCGSCEYWDARPDRDVGRCRIAPPAYTTAGAGFGWPLTGEADWCGRWSGRLPVTCPTCGRIAV